MGLDMGAFDKAWVLLKALVEQQEHLEDLPDTTDHLPEMFDPEAGVTFRSGGTVNPVARAMALRAYSAGKTRGFPLLERQPHDDEKRGGSMITDVLD